MLVAEIVLLDTPFAWLSVFGDAKGPESGSFSWVLRNVLVAELVLSQTNGTRSSVLGYPKNSPIGSMDIGPCSVCRSRSHRIARRSSLANMKVAKVALSDTFLTRLSTLCDS
mmetsp:Transcript_15363/g.28623  ORF Transcript_15363/g.28623 Transcript_15363/m.28623 type:complete len:112 (+) Transcript_15363:693-1028(+)